MTMTAEPLAALPPPDTPAAGTPDAASAADAGAAGIADAAACPDAASSADAASSPDAASPEAATRVLRRFRVVFNAVKTHFRQVEKRAGVGGAQVWALSVVAAQPGIGVGALARAMDIRQATASNLVRSLVAGGWVVAERNGSDRRAVQLRVLPAGRAVLRRAPGPFSGVLPEALARLDPATLARLDADLARVVELLGADPRAAAVPLAQI
jgi:DNA-binding MarR family transcriptional regulator